jgi:hypothetical protein
MLFPALSGTELKNLEEFVACGLNNSHVEEIRDRYLIDSHSKLGPPFCDYRVRPCQGTVY